VRVNAIAPGSVPTPGALGLNDEAEYARRSRSIPLRRLARAGQRRGLRISAERRGLVINGEILHVDGALPPRVRACLRQFPSLTPTVLARIGQERAFDRRSAARVRARGQAAAGKHHHARTPRACGRGAQGLEEFLLHLAPWHDPNSVRPELLLNRRSAQTFSGPRRGGERAPRRAPCRIWRKRFAATRSIIDGLRAREGEIIDAVDDITQPFVYKVLPDLIGLPLEGREHMYAFGNMVWATMGPMNELFHEAMQNTEAVIAWASQCCNRENLARGSLGLAMYAAPIAARSRRRKPIYWWVFCSQRPPTPLY